MTGLGYTHAINFAGSGLPLEPAQMYLFEAPFDQGTLDPILTRGFNNNNGGRLNPSLNSIWDSIEGNYETNTLNPDGLEHFYQEWYIQTVDAAGNSVRPLAFSADNQNVANFLTITATIAPAGAFKVFRTDGAFTPVAIGGNGNLDVYNVLTAYQYGPRAGSSLTFLDGSGGGVLWNYAHNANLAAWDDTNTNPFTFYRPVSATAYTTAGKSTWSGTGGTGTIDANTTNQFNIKTTGTDELLIQSSTDAYLDGAAGGYVVALGTQHAGEPLWVGISFVIGANSCTVAITMNGATGMTAANGWSCFANDETTGLGNTGLYFSANSATTATLTVPAAAAASDVIDFACRPY
jgi:hypothetical protein